MANTISLTEQALYSILHRVQRRYPNYVVVCKEGINTVLLSANSAAETEVRQFLARGGFTAINEQEFRQYYAAEMEAYTRGQQLKRTFQKRRIMWTTGALLALGAAYGLVAWLKSRNNK